MLLNPNETTLNLAKFLVGTEIKKWRQELTNQNNIVFHQENTKHRVSLQTLQIVVHLYLDMLLNSSYLHEFSHSDLFGLYKIFLNGKNFKSLEVGKTQWNHFIAQKDVRLVLSGNMKTFQQHSKRVEQNGTYIVEKFCVIHLTIIFKFPLNNATSFCSETNFFFTFIQCLSRCCCTETGNGNSSHIFLFWLDTNEFSGRPPPHP